MKNTSSITSNIWRTKVLLLVVTITCSGYCNANSDFIDTALEFLLRDSDGIQQRLPRIAPLPVNEEVDPQEGTENSIPINRTLLWRNYTSISGFKDEIDEEFLNQISLVWLTATPPSPQAQHVMAILYTLMMILGVSGNAFVLFMFCKCRALRTAPNTFVANLAFSDLVMVGKTPVLLYNSFRYGPALGEWGCRIYGFLGGFTGTLSITTLTAIAIDRFNVIVYPLSPNRTTTFWKARLFVLFCWFYSFVFSSIPLFKIYSSYVPEGYLTCCSFDYLTDDVDARIFMFCYFFAAWCVPFFTIAYCYIHILRVVLSAKRIQSSKKDKSKQEVKLAAVVFSVIALWFVAWTPYAIVALLGISHNEHLLTPLASMIPAFFAKGAACINPYVYAMTHPRFRAEIRRMVKKKNEKRPVCFTTSGNGRFAETNVDAIRREYSMDGSMDESKTGEGDGE